jgi:hypothetical protein
MKKNALPLCVFVFLFLTLVCGSRVIYGERISERIQLQKAANGNPGVGQGFWSHG